MKILDIEIDFDIEDAESIDRLQKLDQEYAIKIDKATTITEMCQTYKTFFDKVLGEGTSNKLFGEKNNYIQIITAYNELIENLEEHVTKFTEIKQKFDKKYERYK